ncbi:MAG: Rrf2 family transcriptional regulator [Planctomycetota bacterium]
MIYTTTCSYAIRAMSRLAVIRPDGYARIQEVCEGTDMPSHFLAKIFRDLVGAGLLTSAKGRGGGFALAKRPPEIRLIDIVQAIDGTKSHTQCVVGLHKCDATQPCPQHDAFLPVRQQIISYLENTNLDEMSEALARKMEILSATATEHTSTGLPIVKD